jgi:hypothetical protein
MKEPVAMDFTLMGDEAGAGDLTVPCFYSEQVFPPEEVSP